MTKKIMKFQKFKKLQYQVTINLKMKNQKFK